MEICEKAEVFAEKDNDCVFDHSKIILRRTAGGEYFYAKTSQRILLSPHIDINGLDTIHIPGDHIWPLADPQFTRAPEPLPSTYVKRPSLLYYENTPEKPDYGRQILTEVEACEILKKHPHPNIARYLGCIVKDGRIRGLCFTKYSTTLSQMLKDKTSFDKSYFLRGIEAGVRHMHDLGLVHNDLNPANVMMDGDEPVIIDFDSCKREGDELGLKAGTYGWSLEDEECARRENDLYSLSKIQAALMKEN